MRPQISGCLLGTACLLSAPAFGQATISVENRYSEVLVGLEASATGTTWDQIDVGSGIQSGRRAVIQMEPGTACQQHVRAKFADGLSSDGIPVDFCKPNQVISFDTNAAKSPSPPTKNGTQPGK